MAGRKQTEWLRRNIGAFMQQYSRKAQRGREPNDRGYSRDIEREIKQLRPEDLDEVLNGEADLPPMKEKQKDKDSRGSNAA